MSDSARLYRGSLTPDEAVARLNAAVRRSTVTEAVDLAAATGRYLAADLVAPHDLPATSNAAVDGYAVDAAFLAANPDHAFPVIGRAAAGHPFDGQASPGEAVRTFTGAVMPGGTDAVAMHEFCNLDSDGMLVTIGSQLAPGTNNRPAGENLRRGETIIPAGTRLDCADLGIAAAGGMATLDVHQRLKVGLISMGDELVAAGTPPAFGQMNDSNRPMLADMLRGDGHEVEDFGIVADDEAALTACVAAALSGCDAVLSSGGASDGDQDHTQAAMRNNKVAAVFWRLSIKPGRPMSAGVFEGKPVMCLPGNPVAAFVCYRLAAAPVLTYMAGGAARPVMKLRVRCGFAHHKSAGRVEYLRVRIVTGADGEPEMMLHGRKGAGVLSSLTGADGLIEIPVDNEDIAVGDYMPFIPFRETGL